MIIVFDLKFKLQKKTDIDPLLAGWLTDSRCPLSNRSSQILKYCKNPSVLHHHPSQQNCKIDLLSRPRGRPKIHKDLFRFGKKTNIDKMAFGPFSATHFRIIHQ
jgi:hypothetical protein